MCCFCVKCTQWLKHYINSQRWIHTEIGDSNNGIFRLNYMDMNVSYNSRWNIPEEPNMENSGPLTHSEEAAETQTLHPALQLHWWKSKNNCMTVRRDKTGETCVLYCTQNRKNKLDHMLQHESKSAIMMATKQFKSLLRPAGAKVNPKSHHSHPPENR